ncbi:hypothetical protein, partial [Glutamicibacter sp. AOP3-A1-12]|uniref:hypothetical protein n=1 Tax=Glutamicibacter sp. AOP3-A1-12 TaxID=3457701 RepID=UPI004033258B
MINPSVFRAFIGTTDYYFSWGQNDCFLSGWRIPNLCRNQADKKMVEFSGAISAELAVQISSR